MQPIKHSGPGQPKRITGAELFRAHVRAGDPAVIDRVVDAMKREGVFDPPQQPPELKVVDLDWADQC